MCGFVCFPPTWMTQYSAASLLISAGVRATLLPCPSTHCLPLSVVPTSSMSVSTQAAQPPTSQGGTMPGVRAPKRGAAGPIQPRWPQTTQDFHMSCWTCVLWKTCFYCNYLRSESNSALCINTSFSQFNVQRIF
jgi:hypothetical protein